MASDEHDAFVLTVQWLVDHGAGGNGETAKLARRARVPQRTLADWIAGNRPRSYVTKPVRRLHDWATEHVDDYPALAPGSLIDAVTTGSDRADPAPSGVTSPETPVDTDTDTDDDVEVRAPRTPTRRDPHPGERNATRRFGVGALVGVGIAAAVVGAGVATAVVVPLTRSSGSVPSGPPAGTAPAAGSGVPTGPIVVETAANKKGSPVYRSPAGDTVGAGIAARIPYGTVVNVVCHAPNRAGIASVTAFYLIADGPWGGLYTVADTFTNGDAFGTNGTTTLDPNVPACPSTSAAVTPS